MFVFSSSLIIGLERVYLAIFYGLFSLIDCADCDGFSCGSGECYPAEWECDLEPDCSDGSDESTSECSGEF